MKTPKAQPEVLGEVWANGSYRLCEPESPADLSILIPFYRYDCRPLTNALLSNAAAIGDIKSLELVMADDGSPESVHCESLKPLLSQTELPATVIRFSVNQGRSVIRNRLAAAARGNYLLYLDADMLPDNADYLERYLNLARIGIADIVYGGRSALQCKDDPEYRLHREFTALREAVPVTQRLRAPAYHFYSCNFMARRSVLSAIPLDEGFAGWGWEDCEWAARATERYSLLHIDNPATHMGLLKPAQILAKYDESTANFQRMLRLRPEMIEHTSLFRAARIIGRARAGGAIKWLARWVATTKGLPLRSRVAALSIYKACVYASSAAAHREVKDNCSSP